MSILSQWYLGYYLLIYVVIEDILVIFEKE